MAVRLIVTFTARPGTGDEFIRAWADRLPEVHAEPGCEQYELFRSTDRPDTVVLLERWSDLATFDAHSELNRTRSPIGRDFLDGRPSLERFEV